MRSLLAFMLAAAAMLPALGQAVFCIFLCHRMKAIDLALPLQRRMQ